MMRFSCLLILATLYILMSAAYGAEAAPPPIVDAAAPWWGPMVTLVVSGVILPFAVRYLRSTANAAEAQAELHQVDTSKSLIEQRGLLMERLKAYLLGTAAAFAEKRFPELAQSIVDGRLRTAQQIKAELGDWGLDLRQQAIDYFRVQGVDLVSTFGVQALDDLIERAANIVSPFPGKDTAVAILEKNVAPLVISKGVQWVKDRADNLPHFAAAEAAGVNPYGQMGVGSPAPAPAPAAPVVPADVKA